MNSSPRLVIAWALRHCRLVRRLSDALIVSAGGWSIKENVVGLSFNRMSSRRTRSSDERRISGSMFGRLRTGERQCDTIAGHFGFERSQGSVDFGLGREEEEGVSFIKGIELDYGSDDMRDDEVALGTVGRRWSFARAHGEDAAFDVERRAGGSIEELKETSRIDRTFVHHDTIRAIAERSVPRDLRVLRWY